MHIRQPEQCQHPQKSDLQDKTGKETDKVKKNISDSAVGNRTTIEIRARDVPIKRKKEVGKRK